ncbi:MAG: hypothetical protein PSX37_09595 [bacterium]|nr:hypothetical protein [bacterium]
MTIKELIENAHLDALGFLDAEEQVAFDAAFYAASPTVRAQIRDEQARWARMEASLPQVEPGPHLRELVLERIREAITSDQDRVGVTAGGQRRWHRTGMIALGTAAIAFGAAFFTVNTQNQRMAVEFAKNRDLQGPLALFRNGTVMQNVLASSETVRVSFAPANETFAGEAALWMHPSWKGEAKLVVNGLVSKPGRTFRLVALDASNKVIRELSTFAGDGSLALQEVNVSNLAAGVKLAVLDSALGESASASQAILIATFVRA